MKIGELVAMLRLDNTEFDNGTDQAEGKFRGLGGRLGAAGKVIGATAGAGLATSLAVGVAANLEMSAAQSRLSAQLGATGPEAERLGGIAGSLYADAYGENLGAVNEAVRSVVQNIGGMASASNEDIQSITGQVLSLSDAFDQDLGQTTRAIDQMLRTGLAGSAQEALDILAAGFQKGDDEAGDLLDTMNEYGTQFRKVGLDGQTAMGLITQGLQAGARDADKVADAIKEFSIRAVDGSKLTSQGFQMVGLDAADMAAKIAQGGPTASAALDLTLDRLRAMPDPVMRSQAAVALFGTQAEDLGDALYALDPSAAVQALGDVAGASQRTDQALQDTAQKSVESVKRSFQTLAAQAVTLPGPLGTAAAGLMAFGPTGLQVVASLALIGTQIGPLLVKMATMGATAVTTAAKWVAQFVVMAAGTAVQVARMVAQLVVWAAGVVAQGAVALASMVATAAAYVAQWAIMAAGAVARAAIMAASWIVAMGPIGWVIAAVVALVALIIANWDTVKQWTIDAWNAVSGAVSAAWDWIKNAVGAAIDFVVGIISSAWDAVTSVTSTVWDAITGAISGAWDFITGLVSSAVDSVVNFLSSAWDSAVSLASNAWSNIVSAVQSGASNVLSFVGSLPGKILSALGNLGSLLLNAGRDLITGLWNGIAGMGSWLWDKIIGFVKSFVPGPILSFLGIASPSKFMRDEVGKWIPEGLGDGIIANAKAATDAARSLAVDTANAATGATGKAVSGLPGDAWMPPIAGASGETSTSRSVNVDVVINNPKAEKGSDSFAREMADLSTMGAFDL